MGFHVTCGFPSPAEDYMSEVLDINQRVVSNPVATFFATAEGDSMMALGIEAGDTLVIDKSLEPRHGDIVMVNWEGGFMIKQLRRRGGRLELHSGNPANAPIVVPEDVGLDVWGVVTWSFRRQLRR
ncbi:LexA family protein [Xanthomonas citri]|uniref:LexA family protein n=2 Tax=Xanthomonas citri TaxID=346 RepID=UPI0023534679|nr:translesion error-prone DNA polymerase V autoproteolytic subunit [Xanthomonas citri]